MAKAKKKKTPLQKKIEKLDKVFSLFIREKYANWKGEVSCYTCGKTKTVKEVQNGHFISRANFVTRWDEKNCRVQCSGCNVFKNGNYIEFTLRLQKELGKKEFENLMRLKGKSWELKGKEKLEWLDEKIKYYENKIKI